MSAVGEATSDETETNHIRVGGKPSKSKSSRAHHSDTLEAQKKSLEMPIKNLRLPQNENVRSGPLPGLTELASSIKREGILEPLLAAPARDESGKTIPDTYDLIAGYRRYYAAKSLGMKTVPVRLLDADRDRKHRIAIIENLQREDMNPLDKARGILKLMDQEKIDQKEAAAAIGVSPGFVSQHLALLRLPRPVQDAVAKGRIELTHARTLGRLPEEQMLEELPAAVDMTVTELTNRVEYLLQRNAEKEVAQGEEKPRRPRTPSSGKSLAEVYAETELAPLKKNSLRDTLVLYADKLQRSESENKRTEYKYILKGLEIAAGIKEAK